LKTFEEEFENPKKAHPTASDMNFEKTCSSTSILIIDSASDSKAKCSHVVPANCEYQIPSIRFSLIDLNSSEN